MGATALIAQVSLWFWPSCSLCQSGTEWLGCRERPRSQEVEPWWFRACLPGQACEWEDWGCSFLECSAKSSGVAESRAGPSGKGLSSHSSSILTCVAPGRS